MTTGFMWDCKLDQNTYATPKSEGMCYKNGVQTGKDGFSYLTSALTYSDGFTMNYSYTFDRSYGDAYGYVQAKNENGTDKSKKLSFVGNGGIKYGGESGSFEAAIFDVRAMVAMILNDPSIASENELKPEQIRDLSKKIVESEAANNNLKVTGYGQEPISKLIDAMGYGGTLPAVFENYYTSLLEDGVIQQASHTARLAAYLAYSFQNTPVSQTIHLTASSVNTTLNQYSTIIIGNGNTQFYQEQGRVFPTNNEEYSFDGKIHLQAHWGSGVVYSISSIKKMEN